MSKKSRQIQILDLCEAALDREPGERAAWLLQQCGSDDALHSEALVLLKRIDDEDDDVLSAGLYSSVTTGDQVGQYQIEEAIGDGGMGTVYRARRTAAPFEQSVALKVLRAQIVTQALRLRFDLERRVLARLNHPYIASLIDGGTTPKGMPWLVMELVEGVPIDQFCDAQRLSVRDRLALLEKVAMAVQHAHQNLVIHRDLKPSNVLVTNDGIPKLVDFGIAKLIELPEEQELDARRVGVTTQFGQRALTPDYASPEQILDGTVSTASDIYSLGVLAMLVLAGRKPYELDTKTPRSLLESLDNTTVPRASELVVRDISRQRLSQLAQQRSTSPSRLRRLFRGDADTILATALHPDPAKRYSSADAFRADLHRYRTGQAIAARGDTLLSRTLSLVRANKLVFSVLTATLVALSFGLSLALWQARIAQQRFADLHDFSSIVLGDVYDSVADLPGSTDARSEITQAAQRYLDKLVGTDPTLAGRRLHDDELLADLALAYKRLADVQGLPTGANLGESTPAMANYRRALVIAEQVKNETPQTASVRGQIIQRLADVLAWQGDRAGALLQLQAAHTLFASLRAANPDDTQLHMRLAFSFVKIGDLMGHPSFPNLGDHAAAAAEYKKGLALFDNFGMEGASIGLTRSYGVLLERAGTLALVLGDKDDALAKYTLSGAVRATLAAAHPGHTDIQRDAGIATEMIADVLKSRGDLLQALDKYREALAVYRRLADVDEENANAQRTLAYGLENLAEALVLDHAAEPARLHYLEALAIREVLAARDPDSKRLAVELERTRQVLQDL